MFNEINNELHKLLLMKLTQFYAYLRYKVTRKYEIKSINIFFLSVSL